MEIILAVVFIPILLLAFVFLPIHYQYKNAAIEVRGRFIDAFEFPKTISEKVTEKYTHLNEQEVNRVVDGLREYFHVCNDAGKNMVSMPSQVVDVAWHEFILFTRKYEHFCSNAIGRFLHHTPAEAMESQTVAHAGIKRAWRISCLRKNISPSSPTKLPLLFSIDTELSIPDGFEYSLNCKKNGGTAYCAGHIGCGGVGGCGGDSGSCGGGCGGD